MSLCLQWCDISCLLDLTILLFHVNFYISQLCALLITLLSAFAGREMKYKLTTQDIRRELGISAFDEGKLKLDTITRKCEKCGNDEFEYNGKQMRSADEGQTKLLTRTNCGDTITKENQREQQY
ncbi:hypothetical protein BT93_L0834 [Corymbia citriodora subsp. variegata]|uniref:TFIIS-type domain-containing protein n=1 Tax=Corymbia citriodora subsp. variegata TaxID=360336 RepID=A0A8T0CTF6_CORYI|nr:hypothetical protein BT93_L0834 [Corymbia citriodora subsp. variegata]